MARDAGNRREIGVLWGVDGLVSLLQSNGSLKLKEVAAAALWLVSCDTDNAIRVALKVSAVIEQKLLLTVVNSFTLSHAYTAHFCLLYSYLLTCAHTIARQSTPIAYSH
jgi:hypothetical protein